MRGTEKRIDRTRPVMLTSRWLYSVTRKSGQSPNSMMTTVLLALSIAPSSSEKISRYRATLVVLNKILWSCGELSGESRGAVLSGGS